MRMILRPARPNFDRDLALVNTVLVNGRSGDTGELVTVVWR